MTTHTSLRAATVSLVLAVSCLLVPAAAHASDVVGPGGYPGAGAPASREESATAKAPPPGYPVLGIDVSGHDHSNYPIDWPGVAASGVRFAYVKATEGRTFTNPYYAADLRAAKAAGILAGAYAYGRPDLGDPVGQADYLVQQSEWTPDAGTLIPFLDIEWPYGAVHKGPCWDLTPVQLTTWMHQFLDRVEQRIGRKPMIYTNTNWWNPCTAYDATFGDYPLDVASYTTSPPRLPAGWSRFTIWQHAAGANQLPGDYDRDVFNGDLTGLQTLAGPHAPRTLSLRAAANGLVVTAEKAGQLPLIANRPAAGTWERFDVIPVPGGAGNQVALRSQANNRYVTAADAGRSALIANRLAVGTWERFIIVRNADGTVSLYSVIADRYVTAEKGGALPLIANRGGIGTWESFVATEF